MGKDSRRKGVERNKSPPTGENRCQKMEIVNMHRIEEL
jgi:hypothetical protein